MNGIYENFSTRADDLRVSTASGSERGSIDKSFSKASLATARGTDPEVVRRGLKIVASFADLLIKESIIQRKSTRKKRRGRRRSRIEETQTQSNVYCWWRIRTTGG